MCTLVAGLKGNKLMPDKVDVETSSQVRGRFTLACSGKCANECDSRSSSFPVHGNVDQLGS